MENMVSATAATVTERLSAPPLPKTPLILFTADLAPDSTDFSTFGASVVTVFLTEVAALVASVLTVVST